LTKLRLKNFRSYSQLTEIEFSDLNVFIGKNDVGKSSVLKAVDIFFNGKPDKNNLCITGDCNAMEITCIFDEFPERLILDDTVETSLYDEFPLLRKVSDVEFFTSNRISFPAMTIKKLLQSGAVSVNSIL